MTIASRYGAVLAASALMLTGCARPEEEADVAPVVTIDVAPVLNASIQRTIRTSAIVYPLQQAAIAPRISAPIKKIYVEMGARVRAGQLLLELDSEEIAGAARESQAAYELAQANYETTARASLPEEAHKAELEVRAAKDALDAQQSIYNSRQQLVREGAIAQKDLNEALVNLNQARNQYEIARKRLDDLTAFATDQSLKAAAAQRDQAKGRNDSMQAQLAYGRITSPIDGVVTGRSLYAGETAPAGSPIVTVMDVSRIVARAHVSPAEAAELKVGNDATVIAPDGAPVPAKITQISPAVDATNTTVEVWVETPNPDGRFKAGTSLRVELVAKTVPQALVIPQAALLTSASGATSVVVVDAANKPHRKGVTTGIRDAGSVEITEGLDNGQRVVTIGAFELGKLEPDVLEKTTVKIQPPKEEDDEDIP